MVGADDPLIPQEQRHEFEQIMTRAGADWQLHVLGGVKHSFTNPIADARNLPDVQRYDDRAAARSWELASSLLNASLAK